MQTKTSDEDAVLKALRKLIEEDEEYGQKPVRLASGHVVTLTLMKPAKTTFILNKGAE